MVEVYVVVMGRVWHELPVKRQTRQRFSLTVFSQLLLIPATIEPRHHVVEADRRIEEMTQNADDRLAEAKDKGWLGEVAALEEGLKHLRIRADQARARLPVADSTDPRQTAQ